MPLWLISQLTERQNVRYLIEIFMLVGGSQFPPAHEEPDAEPASVVEFARGERRGRQLLSDIGIDMVPADDYHWGRRDARHISRRIQFNQEGCHSKVQSTPASHSSVRQG
jgi:hypothetical protein